MKEWFEIRVPVTPASEESILNFLFELGSQGLQQLDDEVWAYFSSGEAAEKLLKEIDDFLTRLPQFGIEAPAGQATFVSVPEVDWNAEWKKRFKPIRVSDRFTVKPTWEKLEEPETPFVIEIDPKQAFGTGSHETTKLMLQLLEQHEVTGLHVLDAGTGTGILAIAAEMLGAAQVLAFDNDPVAIEAAHENVARNLADAKIRLLVAAPDNCGIVPRSFHLVLANMTKNIIFEHFAALESAVAAGGHLLLSGILATELDEVRARLSHHPELEVKQKQALGEWIALSVQKHA